MRKEKRKRRKNIISTLSKNIIMATMIMLIKKQIINLNQMLLQKKKNLFAITRFTKKSLHKKIPAINKPRRDFF